MVQHWGPLLWEGKSFFVLFAIHETESTPLTKAPSKGVPDVLLGIGSGSSNAARRAHIELNSSLYKQQEALQNHWTWFKGINLSTYMQVKLRCFIPSSVSQSVVNQMKQASGLHIFLTRTRRQTNLVTINWYKSQYLLGTSLHSLYYLMYDEQWKNYRSLIWACAKQTKLKTAYHWCLLTFRILTEYCTDTTLRIKLTGKITSWISNMGQKVTWDKR